MQEVKAHPTAAADIDNLGPLLLALGDDASNWPAAAGSTEQTMEMLELIERDMARYEQAVIPVEHILLPGLYARKITIPADCRLIGKVQVSPHLNFVLEGDITFMVDGVVQRVGAGWEGSIPGCTKKIGYTHKRTVWMTVHPNPDNETDVAVLERRIAVDSYAIYLERTRQLPAGEAA
ncbi:MAG TPA: hypothetical protein VGE36_13835 [Roseateles sp.]